MKTHAFRCGVGGLVAASLLVASCASAGAQSLAGHIPTNVRGISVVEPPPAAFDPVMATTMMNMRFALPPAPDRLAAPHAHRAWRHAIMAVQNRERPVLTSTNIFHGPIKGKKPPSARRSESARESAHFKDC